MIELMPRDLVTFGTIVAVVSASHFTLSGRVRSLEKRHDYQEPIVHGLVKDMERVSAVLENVVKVQEKLLDRLDGRQGEGR